jgi:hypothetical protein
MKEVTISAKLRRAAVAAINGFDEAYFADGGYAEVQTELDTKREGVASHIYKLATKACDDSANLKEALVVFRGACAYAEDRYKEKHEISNVKTRMPAWAQFKSRIVRSMKFGLDPREFGSERSLRDALSTAIRDRAEKERLKAERNRAKITQIDDWMGETGVHTRLQLVMRKLILEAGYVRPSKRKEAEAILQTAADGIALLVDQKAIKSDADRDVLQDIAA